MKLDESDTLNVAYFLATRGQEYFVNYNYDDAKQFYSYAIDYINDHFNRTELIDSFIKDLYFNRAYCYYKLREYENAIEDYNNFLKCRLTDNEKYAGNVNKASIEFYYLNNVNNGIMSLSEVIKIYPDNIYALFERASYYHANQDYHNAIKDYNQLQKLMPNNSVVYFRKALIFYKQNKYQEALKELNIAENLRPILLKVHLYKGYIYADMGMHNKALEAYNKLLLIGKDIGNEDERVKNTPQQIVFSRYDIEPSDLKYNYNIDLEFDYSTCYYAIGKVYNIMGDTTLALDNFNKALSMTKHPDYYYDIGLLLETKKGDYYGAYEMYSTIIDNYPSYYKAYERRAELLYNRKKYEEAIADWSKLIEKGIASAEVYSRRAHTYELLNKIEKAHKDIEALLSIEPDNIEYRIKYIELSLFLGMEELVIKETDFLLNIVESEKTIKLLYFFKIIAMTIINSEVTEEMTYIMKRMDEIEENPDYDIDIISKWLSKAKVSKLQKNLIRNILSQLE